MSRSYAAIQNERQSELLSPVLALFWRGHMKIQLSASAVILATLATSAHADADHDYPKAATAGFSTVKHNANTSTSGSRAPGGRASPGGKTL